MLAHPGRAQQNTEQILAALNGFYRNMGHNADSLFLYAQQCAKLAPNELQRAIHEYYAMGYHNPKQPSGHKAFGQKSLAKLQTGDPVVQGFVYPIVQLTRVRQETDPVKLQAYVNQYIQYLADKPEELGNRMERYGLLIHKDIQTKAVPEPIKDALWKAVTDRIAHAVNQTYYDPNKLTTNQLKSRAYYRYLMAYTQAQQAEAAVKVKQRDKAIDLYAAAVQDGPDEVDAQHNTYVFDASMLSDQEEPVTDFLAPYAEQLIAKGDTGTALKTLAELAFKDASRLEGLKAFHKKSKTQEPFGVFWTRSINEKYKLAEPFSVTTLGGQRFESDAYKGKWVLLDFWGTWCRPCVAEMPEMQKLYNELQKDNPHKLTILTLACHDLEPKVNDFMAKKGYTFPVAMGNDGIIKQFRIGGYPTKVLITPEGRRIRIDFNQDWTKRVYAFINP